MSPHVSTVSPGSRCEGDVLLRRLLFVAFFFEVGLLLVVLPWSAFWERNYFVALWPPLEVLVTNNFVRGAVSGLGLVNLLAGVFELLPVFVVRDHGDPTQTRAHP
jgi:hypothetical protein